MGGDRAGEYAENVARDSEEESHCKVAPRLLRHHLLHALGVGDLNLGFGFGVFMNIYR